MSNALPETERTNIVFEDDLWKQYRGLIIGVSVTLIAAIAIIYVILSNKAKNESEANALYISGSTPEVWESVVKKYPKSEKAADSLLSLAGNAVEKKNYEQALSYFQKFATSFSNHPAYPAVQLAIASSFESLGKKDEAVKAYLVIVKAGQTHPYLGSASVGLARVYESQGKTTEAQNVLNDFIGKHPTSLAIPEAKALLRKADSEKTPSAK